jgi:hypothetical protein
MRDLCPNALTRIKGGESSGTEQVWVLGLLGAIASLRAWSLRRGADDSRSLGAVVIT